MSKNVNNDVSKDPPYILLSQQSSVFTFTVLLAKKLVKIYNVQASM